MVFLTSITLCQTSDSTYSFFVAGHTYGAPGVNNDGLHPPFENKFQHIQSRSEIGFGILLGDIVRPNPIEQDWIDVDESIENLGLPVHFAVGNHDMENREIFESRYGDTYYAFLVSDDLFIVLDPNLDGWNISGNQLEFLDSLLINFADNVENIFVSFHQLLWWESDNKYSIVYPNSLAGRADVVNFWTEIEPRFTALQNQVFFMAGDLGAAHWSGDVLYDNYDNITFIATGMGEGDGDNFVVVNEQLGSGVSFDLICLEDDINCMGSLESYDVDLLGMDTANSLAADIYPTVVGNNQLIFVDNHDIQKIKLSGFNSLGVKVFGLLCEPGISTFCPNMLDSGVYIFLVESNGVTCSHKLVIL